MRGLFEMRGIICRQQAHAFNIHCKGCPSIARKVHCGEGRKDIKHRYVLIQDNYVDLTSQSAATWYFGLIKLCYEVATNACESEDNTLDMIGKLKAMNLIYSKSQPQATIASPHISFNAETGSQKKVESLYCRRQREASIKKETTY